jgi:predicted ATPase/class 3 adenylate cyclase
MLFTDIEGSTRLLRELGPERYVVALERHRTLLRDAVARHGGVEVEMQGDSFHFAFADADAAIAAAAEAQHLHVDGEPDGQPIRVRIGMHTGQPLVTGSLYAGLDVHRAARVMSAAHGRQVLLSDATKAAVGGLPPDLDLRDLGPHRLKDLSEPERLHQLVADGLPSDFPPLRALHETTLPIAPTPFLGRERELDEVQELLMQDDVRLLTLTGPGGTGKTRLALAVAERAVDRFEGGARFVGLAAVTDPELVAAAAAAALDIRQAAGSLVSALAAEIGDRRLLLVVDNFEQVLPAATLLAELLAACPALHLLVTSRAPLHVAAEHEYPVPPFDEEDAVQFLLGRVHAARPTLDLDETATETAQAIAARLDGLPLALELAAARVRVLPLPGLLTRLDAALPLLTGGARDAPARQRTLRATIDWSYGLLPPPSQTLLARLSVFAGGFTLEAAEAVCEARLDVLEALVEHSLIRIAVTDGESRFSMLAVIREYAGELLDGTGEAGAIRDRHAGFHLELATDAEERMVGPETAAQIRRVRREHDNMRAALAWSLATDPVTALGLGTRLQRFFYLGGYSAEGLRALEAALGRAEDVDPLLRGQALRSAGTLAEGAGDVVRARRYLDEALEVLRPLGVQREIAVALNNVGAVATKQGDYDGARSYLEDSIELKRASGDRRGIAITLSNLGMLEARTGEYDAGRAHQEEALASLRELGEPNAVANAVAALGEVAVLEGDPTRARPLLEESLRMCEELGDPAAAVEVLALLARVSLAEGDADAALARLAQAAELLLPLDDAYGAVTVLEATADVLVGRHPARAVWLRSVSSSTRADVGAPETPAERGWAVQTLDRARAALSEREYEEMWKAGTAVDLGTALRSLIAAPAGAATEAVEPG